MQKTVFMRISRGTCTLTRHIMLRCPLIPMPSSDHRVVTPLACCQSAQTRHRVSAGAASGWMGSAGAVARARSSGRASERTIRGPFPPSSGPGSLSPLKGPALRPAAQVKAETGPGDKNPVAHTNKQTHAGFKPLSFYPLWLPSLVGKPITRGEEY